MDSLFEKYYQDMQSWDSCAEIYENRIVSGHPDIKAYENFEEELLDHVLRFLSLNQDRPIKLMDIGCGSGRLHLRYGAKTTHSNDLCSKHPLFLAKKNHPELEFDILLHQNLQELWGIDFSNKMLELAREKVQKLNLDKTCGIPLKFKQGSAFELEHESTGVLPVAVCLINTISVMQGPMGAQELFKSMKRAVEKAGGIAIISCYQKEYIESYGLGQYESTLDVSGQPWWMVPDTYASRSFEHVPKFYKRAFSHNRKMVIDVYDRKGNSIEKDFELTRDPKRTAMVVDSGHIKTYTDYESCWYSYDLIESWVRTFWGDDALHIPASRLDSLRAEPAQLAILDVNHSLRKLFERWNVVS